MLLIRRRVSNLMSTSNPQALASPSSQYSSPPRLLYSGPVPNRDRRASPQPRRGYSPSWPVDSSSPPPLPEWRARRHVPGAFKHYDHHYQEPSRQIQSQMGSDGRPGWRNVISSNDDFPGAYRRLRSPSRGREHFKKDPPVVNLPPDDYLEFAKPTSENKDTLISDKIIPKLLVLDLNGALVYRRRSSGSTPLPRPYLCCFLEYLFLPEPDHADGPRPWEVFVWSSAQPHNVRAMVEACFGQKWIEGIWEDQTETSVDAMKGGEGRLIGVWARDKMGLSGQDYSRKVQTTKNLNLVIDHLNQTTHFNQPLSFSQKTTVLLDDSPLKAVFQPWSQIVIPEFDEQVNLTSRLAAGINPNSRATPDKETAEESQGEMDEVLLAVVGILDELRYVSNVPFWVRSGGLDLALNVDGVEEPTVETLPSHETFQHWYKDKELHAKWVEKGKEALKRKGIEVRHGLVGNAARSPGSPREPRSPRQPYPEPRPTQSDISLSSATSDMPFDKEESAFARRKRLAEERATKEAAGIPLTQKEKKEAKKALSKAHVLVDEAAQKPRPPPASLPHRPVASQKPKSHGRSNSPVRDPASHHRYTTHREQDWNHSPRREYHAYDDSLRRQGALPPRLPSPAHDYPESYRRERNWSPPHQHHLPPPPAPYLPPQRQGDYRHDAHGSPLPGPRAPAEGYYSDRRDWRDHRPLAADDSLPVSSWRPAGKQQPAFEPREEHYRPPVSGRDTRGYERSEYHGRDENRYQGRR